jgi:hypothetical protein
MQSGCFTPNVKWLAVCDVNYEERIHVHSTLSGRLLESRELLADTDESPWAISPTTSSRVFGVPSLGLVPGRNVQVHVLELNNEVASTDDVYLWHFSVPDPSLL